MRTRLGAVLVTVLLVLAAGCGGDDENATQQWAGDVCTDLNTWVASVQATVKGLTDKGLSIQKTDVQAAVDDAESATTDLTSSLKDLGPPPDDSAAQQAKDELDQLGNEIQQQLDNVEQAASSDTGTIQLAQTVAAAVSASASAAKSTFETIESLDVGGDLKNAFQDADSCKELRETIEQLG